jgi:3-deoxy-D-manno-octulosonic acid (KDO) 8-phosphate synthase
MKIKQAKLAQALHGESSNILNANQFHMSFEGDCLVVTHKNPEKAKTHGPFIVFPANLAYLVPFTESVEEKTKAKK